MRRGSATSRSSATSSPTLSPALALGILTAGVFLRLVRTNLIGTLGQQYIDSGRSRGISEFRLVTKHAYRPALIPIVTVMGMQIALMLAGAVLTETTFEWKGIGFKLAEYLTARDFVAVQGIVVMLAVIVAFTNFIVDVIAAFIDPPSEVLMSENTEKFAEAAPGSGVPAVVLDEKAKKSWWTRLPIVSHLRQSVGLRGACSSPVSCSAGSSSSARSSRLSSPPTASTSSALRKGTSGPPSRRVLSTSGARPSAATMSSPGSSGVPRPRSPSLSSPSPPRSSPGSSWG